MPSINDIYATYLKASDLNGGQHQVTITSAYPETLGDGKIKIAITCDRFERPILLNVTNAQALAAVHGEDYSLWVGRGALVYPENIMFQGQLAPAIRMRGTPSGHVQQQVQAQHQEFSQPPPGQNPGQPGDAFITSGQQPYQPNNPPPMPSGDPNDGLPPFNDEVPR